jgi:YegS/Rv2252/BmrU family lipid kinase
MPGLMRATLIHHPGGGSASDEDFERAVALLAPHFELDARKVVEGQNAAELARDAVKQGAELLIASGGDGTVSCVASAAIGRDDVRLGILPRGTSNSISVHLGIPAGLDDACAVLVAGHEHAIDTATANDRSMVLMATLGIHAEAVTEVDPELKKTFGSVAYAIEEVRRLLGDSLFEARVIAGAHSFACTASAITIANMARPANLLAQGPAELVEDDGLLDVTLVAIEGIGEAIATSLHLASRALQGLPAERPNVAHFRAREVHVETSEPRRVMIDGEDAGETPLVVRVLPRSLTVRVPAPA